MLNKLKIFHHARIRQLTIGLFIKRQVNSGRDKALNFNFCLKFCIFNLNHRFKNMSDLELETKHEKYLITIRNLRANNFSKDLPFLILSENLPGGQVYKEFADGRIEIQEVVSAGKKFRTRVIKVLKGLQADSVRKTYGLL
ncbi:hypothetical protein [Pedobacter lusitanus]|nr:hypothetical protein [Pedobacter lusitanus]